MEPIPALDLHTLLAQPLVVRRAPQVDTDLPTLSQLVLGLAGGQVRRSREQDRGFRRNAVGARRPVGNVAPFAARLAAFEKECVPAFRQYLELKRDLVDQSFGE